MKRAFEVGTFTTDKGNTYEIKEIVTSTMLNTFCDEPILYDVILVDGKTRPFSARGIRSIIKND